MKFNKPRYLCVRITRKTKGNYYKNLDLLKDVTDSKKFWVAVKPLGCSKAQTDKTNGIYQSRRKWKNYT